MKKILLVLMVLTIVLLIVACTPLQEHKHTVTGELIVVKEATCGEEGTAHIFCTKCGDIVNTIIIPKTSDHLVVVISDVESTCSKKGLTEGKQCFDCGKIFVAQQEIPLKAHQYDDKYDETCNECGYVRDAECAHKEIEIIEGKTPTCTGIGYTDGTKCKKCGEILDAQEVIKANGHNFGKWVIVKEATTTEEGLIERTCECGGKESKVIPKVLPPSEGLEFSLNDDGKSYSVTGMGTCTDTIIVIPSTYDGLPVTNISDFAFMRCKLITSIYVPDSVTSIGKGAFALCYSLTCIDVHLMNDYYQSIDGNLYSKDGTILIQYAIGNPSNTFNIPNSVTHIGAIAFFDCDSLSYIRMTSSVTVIGEGAFAECTSLTSILNFPNSITNIGSSAFEGCDSFVINFIGTLEEWDSINKDNICYEGVNECHIYCIDAEIHKYEDYTSVILPDEYLLFRLNDDGQSYSVAGMKNYLRDGVYVDIFIPDKYEGLPITGIDDYAFSNCPSLSYVSFPSSVTKIGNFVFDGCTSLEVIKFKGMLKQWNTVIKGDKWDSGAFDYYTVWCDDVDLSKNGVVTIWDKGLEYTLNDDGESYSVTGIGEYLYDEIYVHIPSYYNGLPVTSIGNYAFSNNKSIISIYIPELITNIGDRAFDGCVSLESIVCHYFSVNQWYDISKGAMWCDNTGDFQIFCHDGVVVKITQSLKYKLNDDGQSYSVTGYNNNIHGDKMIVIPSEYNGLPVTSVGDMAFQYCDSITIVVIPNSVASIGRWAFEDCGSLTSIHYEGTKEQWNILTQGSFWDENTGTYTIHCIDGTISK